MKQFEAQRAQARRSLYLQLAGMAGAVALCFAVLVGLGAVYQHKIRMADHTFYVRLLLGDVYAGLTEMESAHGCDLIICKGAPHFEPAHGRLVTGPHDISSQIVSRPRIGCRSERVARYGDTARNFLNDPRRPTVVLEYKADGRTVTNETFCAGHVPDSFEIAVFNGNEQTSALGCQGSISGPFGSIGGGLGCLGCQLRIVQAIAYDPQLPKEQANLKPGSNEQEKGKNREPKRVVGQPPIKRRLLIGLVSLLGYLGLCLMAGQQFYRKRYGIGSALIGGGFLLAGTGFVLVITTYDPLTWGWPI